MLYIFRTSIPQTVLAGSNSWKDHGMSMTEQLGFKLSNNCTISVLSREANFKKRQCHLGYLHFWTADWDRRT